MANWIEEVENRVSMPPLGRAPADRGDANELLKTSETNAFYSDKLARWLVPFSILGNALFLREKDDDPNFTEYIVQTITNCQINIGGYSRKQFSETVQAFGNGGRPSIEATGPNSGIQRASGQR